MILDSRMKLILASFDYQNVWSLADLEETHFPSVTFPAKVDIQITLNAMVTYGILEIERDLYRKAQ